MRTFPPMAFEMTAQDAAGAWPKGTRVRKARSEEGDLTPPGALGTVLGSMGPMPHTAERPDLTGLYGYAVAWDGGLSSFIVGWKLERVGGDHG